MQAPGYPWGWPPRAIDSKVTFWYFLRIWFLPLCFLIAEMSHGHKFEPSLLIRRVPTWRRLAHLRSGSCPCSTGLVTWWTGGGGWAGGTGVGRVGVCAWRTPLQSSSPQFFSFSANQASGLLANFLEKFLLFSKYYPLSKFRKVTKNDPKMTFENKTTFCCCLGSTLTMFNSRPCNC